MFDPDHIDPVTCGIGEIASALAAITKLRGRLDVLETQLVRRAETLADQGVGPGGPTVLSDQKRLSGRRVEQTTRRADTLAAAPVFEARLSDGAVSADHVDVLGRVANFLPDDRRSDLFDHADELADAATSMTPDRFERHARRFAQRLDIDDGETRLEHQQRNTTLRRWTDPATGMLCLHGEFDPETGSRLYAALDAETNRLANTDGLARDDRTAAHALVSLVTASGSGASGPPRPAELVVIVDEHTQRHGLHPHSVCETTAGTPLPPSTIARLSCDGDHTAVTLGSNGVALSVGRRQRSATRHQRRALRAMYPTCGFDNCDRNFDQCEIHHLVPWEHGGPTDLDNLLPLCVRHHHLVHDRHWTLHLDHDRMLTITRADGQVHARAELPSAPEARQRRTPSGRHPNNTGSPTRAGRREAVGAGP